MTRKPHFKPTRHEQDIRVTKVAALLVRALSRPEILRFCEKEWGMPPRTVDDYIARARESLRQELAVERHDMAAMLIARMELVAKEGLRSGELSAVVNSGKVVAQLTGLMNPRGMTGRT